MDDERFDAIVVGAGPAGITAAKEMAAAGLSVVVLERGAYPGAKNVSGGILYRQPTEAVCPGFEGEAPLERPIIEQRYLALTEDAMLGGIYRSMRFATPPYNSYSVLRSEFDQWYAAQAEVGGAEVYPEFTVTDLLWEDGRVAGVTTGEPDGELPAHVVVLADGANSLLAQRAGLHQEWQPHEQALIAKELIALPEGTIEDRFALPKGLGAAYEIFGESTWGLLGYGFIYTNKASLSIGTGALLSDLIGSGRNVNDMLDRFKRHPAIEPLIAGGGTIEYSGHLIPEVGHGSLPQLYSDGVVVVGDAAALVNPVNREGANLAMLSGAMAAKAIIEAKENEDFSARSLRKYQELLEDSIVIEDLKKVEPITPFAQDRPQLFRDYPNLISEAAYEYLTVDGRSKKEKQQEILGRFRNLSKRQLMDDAIGALRTFS
jgi:electron transfer flavoprotein-quinone oxidoreductase